MKNVLLPSRLGFSHMETQYLEGGAFLRAAGFLDDCANNNTSPN
jgi:hypothetical protein